MCGASIEQRIPEGENRLRHCCTQCDHIHYLNPKIIVGTLPVRENQILLCRRAIDPRKGLWTLPAGFMENKETLVEGACRETFEETGAKVRCNDMIGTYSIPEINQVYVMFSADFLTDPLDSTPESLEVVFFDPEAIPWAEIAFPVMRQCLEVWLGQETPAKVPDIRDIRFNRKTSELWVNESLPGGLSEAHAEAHTPS